MKFSRALRHLSSTGWALRRTFSRRALDAIQKAISESERIHGGEIRVAIEASLNAEELVRGVTPRDRAVQAFAQLGVWDTHANNGVLIYLLWADRDVEIVADRGYNGRVTAEEWAAVCRRMESLFANGDAPAAMIEGIRAVGALIALHYPRADHNELPNRPVML